VARDLLEYEDAFKLLHLVYAFQGHVPVGNSDLRITPQHVLPESTVIVAYEGDMLVGTITVTQDSPAGVPLDSDLRTDLDRLRQRGPLVELGSLAVVRRCWRTGLNTLLLLAAYRFARYVVEARSAVIAVEPRYADYYRALYGFEAIAAPQQRDGAGPPLLTMSQDLRALPEFVRRHFKKPMQSGQTLAQHMLGEPMPCVVLPEDVPLEELGRWKMSRQVFRELFIEQVNRIDSLDPATLRHLRRSRSRLTLMGAAATLDPDDA
jgi:hypothetical protein